jgi:hypothetical protein
MDFTHPVQLLAANIDRYRQLLKLEIDPEQRAKLQEALTRDLKAQAMLARSAPHNTE